MSSSRAYPSGVSVIICCFNSSKRLPQTLKHLAAQQFKKFPRLPWEVLLVDNGSADDSVDFAVTEWAKYHTGIPMHVIYQPIPGNGNAKEKGMQSVNYEFFIFCDDDNWLPPFYIEYAYEAMVENKDIAALGGNGIPECEITPPVWFEELKGAYALGAQGPQPCGPITVERGFIYAAGSIFRKAAVDELYNKGYTKILSGRTAKSLGGGDEVELCYALILNGQKIYYSEQLKFQHFMPAVRLNWPYFKRLNHSFGITFPVLMPYKILMMKQTARYKYGIGWLYLSAVYLLIRDIFLKLPASLFGKKYYRARADLSNHWGFATSLLHNRKIVKELYRELPQQRWILAEYTAFLK